MSRLCPCRFLSFRAAVTEVTNWKNMVRRPIVTSDSARNAVGNYMELRGESDGKKRASRKNFGDGPMVVNNQVPATWFLATQDPPPGVAADGAPFTGRRRLFYATDKRAGVTARVVGCVPCVGWRPGGNAPLRTVRWRPDRLVHDQVIVRAPRCAQRDHRGLTSKQRVRREGWMPSGQYGRAGRVPFA